MMANTYSKSGKCGCGDSTPKSACKCGGGCGGYETSAAGMMRPYFFAGQLLTEDDLQALTNYVGRKQQLHNRFLFGAGVVCGLEVSCNPCGGGQVTVKPGYALDCCGNDLVLDCATTLDLNGMIRDLRRDQLGGYDCGDPCADQASAIITTTTTNTSLDVSAARAESGSTVLLPGAVEQVAAPTRHYCLYIRYNEQPSDPVSPYSTGADCGSPHCEPTRIREGVRFELRCQDEKLAPNLLLQRLCGCLGSLKTLQEILSLTERLNSTSPTQNQTEFNAAFDKVHQWLLERLDHSPDMSDCALRTAVRAITRPIIHPIPTNPNAAGGTTAEKPEGPLLTLLRRYLRDCLCRLMTPPCAPCDDDGVLLACVEMSKCEIVKVCASKRQIVLSPSAVRYWLPPLQWIGSVLEQFCCGTFDSGVLTEGRLDFEKLTTQQILQSLEASRCDVGQRDQQKVKALITELSTLLSQPENIRPTAQAFAPAVKFDSSQLFSMFRQLMQTATATAAPESAGVAVQESATNVTANPVAAAQAVAAQPEQLDVTAAEPGTPAQPEAPVESEATAPDAASPDAAVEPEAASPEAEVEPEAAAGSEAADPEAAPGAANEAISGTAAAPPKRGRASSSRKSPTKAR
jgi:hypothetical protein